MTKYRITYTIANRVPRREIVIVFKSEPSARSVARAILKHEFAEVDAPFGIGEAFTAEQALARFAITDVSTAVLDD